MKLMSKVQAQNMANNFKERYGHIDKYGFVICNEEFITEIASMIRCKVKNKSMLSVGCGVAYLEKCLQDKGINMIATDTNEWHDEYPNWANSYMNVEELDAISAIHKYSDKIGMVLMAWPYMDSMAYKVAKECHDINVPILYIGEQYGGCTADDKFFNYMNKFSYYNPYKSNYVRFFGINDFPVLYTWKDSKGARDFIGEIASSYKKIAMLMVKHRTEMVSNEIKESFETVDGKRFTYSSAQDERKMFIKAYERNFDILSRNNTDIHNLPYLAELSDRLDFIRTEYKIDIP